MHLQEYLDSKGISPAEFARLMGTNRSTVHRYLKSPGNASGRMPMPAQMRKITKLTKGKVRPEDFYQGLHPKPRRIARKAK